MTSLDRYIAERRNSRHLAAISPNPETDQAIAETENRIDRAAQAAYADGYSSEQLIAAEHADCLND